MTVYVYPADPYACGHYRLAWPALALKAAGHKVEVIMPADRDGVAGDIDTRTNRLTNVRVPDDAEVVVLQRVAFAHMAQAVGLLRQRGIAVVVDMDDDLTKIDPNNPAFAGLQVGGYGRLGLHNWRNAHQACLDATLVTVSTPALLPVYAPHGRGMVLENCVPQSYLGLAHGDLPTFGWAGSVHSHPADLQAVGPAVQRLVRDGLEYVGVGPDYGDAPGDGALARAYGLDASPKTTGPVSLEAYPLAIAAHLGVGMAPLADTKFNDAKSWLKPLEYMALGVPFVASPRAEYARLVKRAKVGRLAAGPKDWYREVRGLVMNRNFRQEISQAGREAAAAYTIEGNAWRWADAWSKALIDQHSMPLA